ncbi:unnamed protein product [Closterium sp. NIES-54]
MSPSADLLTELEPSPVKHVTSALGQRAEVKGMGKAMFKGADGKMVGVKNVLLVPNVAANLISVQRLQKSDMDTSSKGAKTYTARLGKRILWELHEDKDVYNEMWQIPVVPMPKERQVGASVTTKGEAVGSGVDANDGIKENESKKLYLGGTGKQCEHKESGEATKEQQKGEENLEEAAEEEYGESMWGTIASAAFSNPTSATGECDWLTLHRHMGHVALPILQQLLKEEMVPCIRVKGEPNEERQVGASVTTKGEAVGSGVDANDGIKENESKKLYLGGTGKQCEHKESGEATKEQQKGEENLEEAAEEEYGESMWGTIASAAFSNPTSATGECDWLTLHRHMGHVALPILQHLLKEEMVPRIRVKGEPNEAMAKGPLDEVVMDVVGPLKLGASGAEYFLTIVDVYTHMTWVYVLSKKSDVDETVTTDWLPMVERQQDRLVKAIRTDRGGEFLSKDFSMWLKKNGIRHSLTMPYSPAMNGIAERANRTITETARGLLIEAGLPAYFWPDAVWTACVSKNRALNHVGADKLVPYVEWIGRKPKVDMLRVFGCMCMALVPKHLRHNKLGA